MHAESRMISNKKIPSIEIQSVMICCVIASSSFVPGFNSIYDTLQEILAIENSTSLTPKCPWDPLGIWLHQQLITQ